MLYIQTPWGHETVKLYAEVVYKKRDHEAVKPCFQSVKLCNVLEANSGPTDHQSI